MPKVSDDDLARRREEILTASRRCFSEYGYEGATVKRLEEATGRTRGAIFHHFGDKQELFFAIARDDALSMADVAAHDGLIDVMRNIISDPTNNEWALTRAEIMRLIRTDPAFRTRWEKEEKIINDAVRERIHAQIDAGVMRTDVDPATISVLLDIVFEGVMATIGAGKSVDRVNSALDFLEESLRTRQS